MYLTAHALLLGERIDLRRLKGVSGAPGVLGAPPEVSVFFYRWGAVVFIGADAATERALRDRIAPYVIDPIDSPAEDILRILPGTATDGVRPDNVVTLKAADGPRLALVADALARSAALTYQEATMGVTFDRMDPVIDRLRNEGKLVASSRVLLTAIGKAIWARTHAAARVQIEDRPDMLWHYPELDPLYDRLAEDLELAARAAAVERKLGLIGETVQTVLALVEARRSLRLEIAVVLLIAFEAMATAYTLLPK